jgi:hypothetical protein
MTCDRDRSERDYVKFSFAKPEIVRIAMQEVAGNRVSHTSKDRVRSFANLAL